MKCISLWFLVSVTLYVFEHHQTNDITSSIRHHHSTRYRHFLHLNNKKHQQNTRTCSKCDEWLNSEKEIVCVARIPEDWTSWARRLFNFFVKELCCWMVFFNIFSTCEPSLSCWTRSPTEMLVCIGDKKQCHQSVSRVFIKSVYFR